MIYEEGTSSLSEPEEVEMLPSPKKEAGTTPGKEVSKLSEPEKKLTKPKYVKIEKPESLQSEYT